MMAVYQNLNKTRTFRVEKRGLRYEIVEHDSRGKFMDKLLGTYNSAEEAEIALEIFADDNGYRWAGNGKI